jgi:hypothetical protein
MPIQPNALISIFAVIAKAALIYTIAGCISQSKWLRFHKEVHQIIDLQRFDDASRGPWGSTQFLWRFRFREPIASVGCIITVVALAIDPFTQQIIEYPSRQVSSGVGSATTQRCQAYESGTSSIYTLATGK